MTRASEELERLRAADLPRLSWTDVIADSSFALSEEQRLELEKYFRQFVRAGPFGIGACVCCGNPQGGLWHALGLGFTWGIVHGEGECVKCGWPARAYHIDVAPRIPRIEMILQFHPDEVRMSSEIGGVS